MVEITYHIKDIHCDKCVKKIRQAIGHLSGVEDIQIDLNKKLLQIVGETDPNEMICILQDIGYTPVIIPEDHVE
jgi:copper chaperone CopZ